MRRRDSPEDPKSRFCWGGKPPPGREPLSAPFASTLSTLNLLASGLWWVFPLGEAFILEPPPLPSRTPPLEAVPALRALLPGTWRMPLACRIYALWEESLKLPKPTLIPYLAPSNNLNDRLIRGQAFKTTPPDGCNFLSFAIASCVFVHSLYS